MSTYQLSILTPQGEIFNDQVVSLTASGQLGEFGVLANHAPMIVSLNKAVMKLSTDAGEKFFAHETGILEVKPNHDVLVLVDDAFSIADALEGKEKLAASAHG